MVEPNFHLPRVLTCPVVDKDPLPEHINRHLIGMLISIDILASQQGRQHFAIVTHRDPDADAIASLLAMRELISGMVPNAQSVSIYFDLSSKNRERALARYNLNQRPTEQLVSDTLDPLARSKTAIVLVDQPSLRSGIVLSEAAKHTVLNTYDADIIVDHHGERPRLGHGVVISPSAWSTSALMLRALQIATASDLISDKWTQDPRLLNHLVVGAEIDAGALPDGTETGSTATNPVLQWIRECCISPGGKALALERLRDEFDLTRFSTTLTHRTKRQDLGVFELAGKPFRCEIAYCGVAAEKEHLAACATQMIKQMTPANNHNADPVVLVCLAVLQEGSTTPARDGQSLLEGQRVQVAIRSNDIDLPVDAIAKVISRSGGGRKGMAAAHLQIPHELNGRRSSASFLGEAGKMIKTCLFSGFPSETWQIPEPASEKYVRARRQNDRSQSS